jgi:hypothetical protein
VFVTKQERKKGILPIKEDVLRADEREKHLEQDSARLMFPCVAESWGSSGWKVGMLVGLVCLQSAKLESK